MTCGSEEMMQNIDFSSKMISFTVFINGKNYWNDNEIERKIKKRKTKTWENSRTLFHCKTNLSIDFQSMTTSEECIILLVDVWSWFMIIWCINWFHGFIFIIFRINTVMHQLLISNNRNNLNQSAQTELHTICEIQLVP